MEDHIVEPAIIKTEIEKTVLSCTDENSASNETNLVSGTKRQFSQFVSGQGRNKTDKTDLISTLCDICHEAPAKYKFKCCCWKCCSLECFRLHQKNKNSFFENEELLPPQCDNANSNESHLKDESATVFLASCGGPEHSSKNLISTRKRQNRNTPTNSKTSLSIISQYDEEDTSSLLTEDEKKRLETNPALIKWFDSFSLRRAVRSITNASSRVDKLGELITNHEFAEFIHDIMDTLDLPESTKPSVS